jgi:hypothetical protein
LSVGFCFVFTKSIFLKGNNRIDSMEAWCVIHRQNTSLEKTIYFSVLWKWLLVHEILNHHTWTLERKPLGKKEWEMNSYLPLEERDRSLCRDVCLPHPLLPNALFAYRDLALLRTPRHK